MRLNVILSEVDPFNFKSWKEFLNQYAFMVEQGLSLNDIKEAIKIKEKEDRTNDLAALSVSSSGKHCPECDSFLQLLPVNDSPSTQTNDNSKSMWLCRNCHYEIFSNNDIKEELEQLSKEPSNG